MRLSKRRAANAKILEAGTAAAAFVGPHCIPRHQHHRGPTMRRRRIKPAIHGPMATIIDDPYSKEEGRRAVRLVVNGGLHDELRSCAFVIHFSFSVAFALAENEQPQQTTAATRCSIARSLAHPGGFFH
jgi:hypothetical protein